MAKAIDLTDKTFGRWTVLYKDDSSIGSKTGLKSPSPQAENSPISLKDTSIQDSS